MNSTMEKVSSNKVKLRMELDAEAFEQAMQKAYLKLRGRINVPGFRKGKAPRKLIERMYGESIFYEEAFDEVFPGMYEEAVKALDIEPVGQPDVDIETIGGGQALVVTGEVYVKPEVTLGQYKGLDVQREDDTVDDEAVEQEIGRVRQRNAREEEVTDRAVQDDDIVNLDYAGTVDGEAFEGGTAQGQSLTIGSGQFIPGFEEQMVGMQIGEERDIHVRFPDEYHAEALKGKDAVFHVKVNGIRTRELPELDDEFAKDVSEFDTLKAYEADVKKKIKERKEDSAEAALERKIIESVVENASVNVPQCMINDETEEMVNEFAYRLMYQGMNIDDYFKYTGQTPEKLKETYVEPATKAVKTRLVLEQVIKAAGIEVTPEDEEAVYADLASRQNKSVEEICEYIGADSLHYLTVEELKETCRTAKLDFCTGCFDAGYPYTMDDYEADKHKFE